MKCCKTARIIHEKEKVLQCSNTALFFISFHPLLTHQPYFCLSQLYFWDVTARTILRFPVHQPRICFCFFRELFDTCLVFSSAVLTTVRDISCYLSHLLFSHIQQLLHKISSVFTITTQCVFFYPSPLLSYSLLSSWGRLEERADRRRQDGEKEVNNNLHGATNPLEAED